ncbi:MAG: site-specific integrase [Clostridia bacterium]|nr:site-specific integrase [Clostridia bacterium]
MAEKNKLKRRKDGRLKRSVFLGYKPDGSEDREYVYGYTEKEVEANLFELKMKIARKERIVDDNVTVAEWANIWMESYKTGKEFKTLQMYDITIRNHIIKELGHLRLVDLKPFHIQGLINSRFKAGMTKTLKNIRQTLRQMLDQAIENDLLIKNPAIKIELPSKAKMKELNPAQRRALTNEETDIIRRAKLDTKKKAFVYLLLDAGLRRGEALALTKKDISKSNITVSKTLVFENSLPVIKEHPKTSAGFRKVPIPITLKPILDDYLKKCNGMYLFEMQKKPGLMTESSYKSFWNSIWNACNKAAGGKHDVIAFAEDITPHVLRHTYATMLYYAGVDLKQAQYLMGHENADVLLNLYTHLKNEESAPTDRINSYLSASGSNRGQNASS